MTAAPLPHFTRYCIYWRRERTWPVLVHEVCTPDKAQAHGRARFHRPPDKGRLAGSLWLELKWRPESHPKSRRNVPGIRFVATGAGAELHYKRKLGYSFPQFSCPSASTLSDTPDGALRLLSLLQTPLPATAAAVAADHVASTHLVIIHQYTCTTTIPLYFQLHNNHHPLCHAMRVRAALSSSTYRPDTCPRALCERSLNCPP